jgi:cell division protein FtsW
VKLRLPRRTSYDLALLVVVIALTLLGIAMVYSASGIGALDQVDDPRYYLGWQSLWALIGLAGMLVAMRVDYHHYRLVAVPLLLLALGLLAAVLVPGVGTNVNGAARWLRVGSVGLQPGELAKLALIVYLAAWLGAHREEVRALSVFIPFAVVTGATTALLVAEPDFGTALVILAIAMAMYFVAGARLRVFAALATLAGTGALAVAVAAPYRVQRLVTFVDPWSDPDRTGYQTIQALYGLARGGLFGEGLGAGREKFGYLPFPYTDSIFSILGNELGLAGTLAVIVLFLVLAYRGVAIALRASDATGSLLAAGITTWLVLQAWINMSVVSSLLPMTGITLPFISYGGSSLCVGLIAVGILLNVGQQGGGAAPAGSRARSVSRAPRRRRNGGTPVAADRDRRGAPREHPGRSAALPRWSPRARG